MFVDNVANVVSGSVHESKKAKVAMMTKLGVVTMFVLVNLVLGPWLWNNVLRRLVPALGKAQWYDTVLLSVLLSLVQSCCN